MPNLRLLTLALGLSMLVTGCGVRHPEQVESLAEAAAEDPRKTGKLVAALRSKHEEVRVAAQEALVELGSSAAPELRDVVLRRKPEAGPALLVLGLMGDPDHFPLLEQHLGDPTLGPWARDGLEQGSVALWNRIAAEPDMALCDAYLQWFPEGAHSEAARDLRRELEAEAALAALGPDPRYGALVSYHRRYGDTRAGEAARLRLASRALADALTEIENGRPRQALRYVEEAREWDGEVDADPVEAAARESWAASLAEQQRWDPAIEQLTLAAELGGGNSALLGDHHHTRAQQRFAAGDPVGGMIDLLMAERTFTPLTMPVTEERKKRGKAVLEQLRKGEVTIQVGIEALAMAGPELVDGTQALVWERLVAGEPEALVVLVQAASAPVLGDPAGDWLDELVSRALTETTSQVEALFADPERLARLLEPGTLWSREGELGRRDSLALVRAYEGAVQAANAHIRFGRQVTGELPETAPEPDVNLRTRIAQGADPQDPQLSLLVRAQLLRFSLAQVEVIRDLAWRQPGLLASRFVGRELPPVTMAQWALLAAEAQEARRQAIYKVTLSDGNEAELIIRVSEGAMRVEISLFGPSVPLTDEAVGDALTVLFGTARPLLYVHADVSQIDVVMGMTLADGTLDTRVRLGLDQRTAQHMNWSLVEAEAPYSIDHLALVLDQEIR